MREIAKSFAGDRAQTVQFALADFDKSRMLCKDARYHATQRVLRGLAVSFRHCSEGGAHSTTQYISMADIESRIFSQNFGCCVETCVS